jgi:regulator of sigma E protease
MEILIKIVQLILSLSILVVLHELGHFLFAKLFKTRVEKFYLFFNPWFALIKFKKGETEYGIGWLPLGGYVKISGMIDESMDKEQLKQPPQPYEFRSKPAWQRLLIMVGGVTVNFLTAIVIFWMLLYAYGEQYVPVSNAKYGLYYNEIAREIGLKDGDIVLMADNYAIDVPNDIPKYIAIYNTKVLTVKRGDSTLLMNVPSDFGQKLIASGIKGFADFQVPVGIDSILPKENASYSGMIKGDNIVSINNKPASFFHQFAAILAENKGKEVTITVKRDTSVINLKCKVSDQGKIGIGLQGLDHFFKVKIVKYSFLEALPAGVSQGYNTLASYVKGLSKIFTKEGVKQVGGFGAIGGLFPSFWNWRAFWGLTALLSVVLAFMNILPIPALDGGFVIFLLYEIVTGRKPSDKFLEYAQIVGMLILLTLLVYANGNDIFRYFFK